jgi:hypothetical protein
MENKNLKQFIANIADKNYKQASTCLQKVVEDKLKSRIKQDLNEKK